MFKYAVEHFNKKENDKVLEYYKDKLSIEEICKLTKLNYNEVLFLLSSNKQLIRDNDFTCLSLLDKKILIISDTHIGSTLDNISYLDIVYNYAVNNNVNTILHGGDLIQSTMDGVKKQLSTAYNQIQYLIKNYPKDNNINNYIVLGNHDFHGLRGKKDNYDLLNSRDDINILGFNRVFINWVDNVISLSHKLDKYQLKLPNIETKVNFVGHRHGLRINDRPSIFIPTLSDDLKDYEGNFPGFLCCYLENNELIIDVIYIKNKEIEQTQVLKKELK